MPTTTSNLTTFSEVARLDEAFTTLDAPSNAQTSNDVRAAWTTVVPESQTWSSYIKGVQLVTPPDAGVTVTEIRVILERRKSGAAETLHDSAVHLVKGGVIQTAVNTATATAYTTSDVSETHTFTAANLATLGITITDVRAADFGVAFSFNNTIGATGTIVAQVDHMFVEVDWTPAGSGFPPSEIGMMGCGIN